MSSTRLELGFIRVRTLWQTKAWRDRLAPRAQFLKLLASTSSWKYGKLLTWAHLISKLDVVDVLHSSSAEEVTHPYRTSLVDGLNLRTRNCAERMLATEE